MSEQILKAMLDTSIVNYSFDTENAERNYELAVLYHALQQTAAAVSFYLRAAERTEDKDLAYYCLLNIASCFDKQGNRSNTVRCTYKQALMLCPNRPEAYYFLSRHYESINEHMEAYIYANLALAFVDFDNIAPLRGNIGYPGKYALTFQKAVCSWWWGKNVECREILQSLYDNSYDEMDDIHKSALIENMTRLGLKTDDMFGSLKGFNWGTLPEADVYTIKKEILDDKTYDYWRQVKENDIVVDVGASVGPFTCNILKNKPSKVYCVEPSKDLVETLKTNIQNFNSNSVDIKTINQAIVNGKDDAINIFGNNPKFDWTTFKDLIKKNKIDKINFLKIDCEGGEYAIFNDDNIDFLVNNVEFMAVEFHLKYENGRQNFKNFRDKYLSQFKNYQIKSCVFQKIQPGVIIDLDQYLKIDHFVDTYDCEFMVYIWNNENE